MATSAAAPRRPARALRRLAGDPVWRHYAVAWLGGIPIAIANGTARELLYKDRVGDLAGHQISTATAIALFAGYLAALERHRPIPTARGAIEIGATWVALTVCFEFGFGHFADRRTWSELAADYDLSAGRVWALVLLWLGVGPLTVRRLLAR